MGAKKELGKIPVHGDWGAGRDAEKASSTHNVPGDIRVHKQEGQISCMCGESMVRPEVREGAYRGGTSQNGDVTVVVRAILACECEIGGSIEVLP